VLLERPVGEADPPEAARRVEAVEAVEDARGEEDPAEARAERVEERADRVAHFERSAPPHGGQDPRREDLVTQDRHPRAPERPVAEGVARRFAADDALVAAAVEAPRGPADVERRAEAPGLPRREVGRDGARHPRDDDPHPGRLPIATIGRPQPGAWRSLMRRALSLAAVLGLVAFVAALRADDSKPDDAKPAKLSWNPFAAAKVGDWTAGKMVDGEGVATARMTWTIEKVDGETVTVLRTIEPFEAETEREELTFSRTETPTIRKFLQHPASVKLKGVERKAVETPVGAGEEISFLVEGDGAERKGRLVLAKGVKGMGLVSFSLDPPLGDRVGIEIVGHGSKDKVEWGTRASEVKLAKGTTALTKAKVATARMFVASLKAACMMYEVDTGFFPRGAASVDEKSLLRNDNAALCAALLNRPTIELGGGPNSPYIEWEPGFIGHAKGEAAEPLAAGESDDLQKVEFQKKHGPATKTALVLLDPWKNPFVYREWMSVRARLKDGEKQAHDKNSFDLYSFGPDGKDDKGEGDDVASWRR
jgi:hypothetical protein